MKMKGLAVVDKILSEYKRYNANTRDSNVGDCVKRSLSVAYSLDYDDVSRELNQIKRNLGESAFNSYPVFESFLKKRGDAFKDVGSELTKDENKLLTVEEFCEILSSGVYLLLVGKRANRPTHMAAVVNGDLYDSWNSSSWIVDQYAVVTSGKSEVYESMDYHDVKDQLDDILEEQLAKLQSKCPDCMHLKFHGKTTYKYTDDYTYYEYISCELGDVPKYSSYRSNISYGHEFTIKLNPRISPEENLEKLAKKTKQRVYDWVYNIRKDIVDAEKAESIDLNPSFSGNPTDLMKLPEWARPLVTSFDVDDWWSSYKYRLCMDPLPDDEEGGELVIYTDTLSELKFNLDEYKKHRSRYF